MSLKEERIEKKRRLTKSTSFTFRFEENENIIDTSKTNRSSFAPKPKDETYTGPLTLRIIDRFDDGSRISTRTCVHWPWLPVRPRIFTTRAITPPVAVLSMLILSKWSKSRVRDRESDTHSYEGKDSIWRIKKQQLIRVKSRRHLRSTVHWTFITFRTIWTKDRKRIISQFFFKSKRKFFSQMFFPNRIDRQFHSLFSGSFDVRLLVTNERTREDSLVSRALSISIMSDEEKFDALLMNIASQHTNGIQEVRWTISFSLQWKFLFSYSIRCSDSSLEKPIFSPVRIWHKSRKN